MTPPRFYARTSPGKSFHESEKCTQAFLFEKRVQGAEKCSQDSPNGLIQLHFSLASMVFAIQKPARWQRLAQGLCPHDPQKTRGGLAPPPPPATKRWSWLISFAMPVIHSVSLVQLIQPLIIPSYGARCPCTGHFLYDRRKNHAPELRKCPLGHLHPLGRHYQGLDGFGRRRQALSESGRHKRGQIYSRSPSQWAGASISILLCWARGSGGAASPTYSPDGAFYSIFSNLER